MARHLLGGWGRDLSDESFGRALAVLGVVTRIERSSASAPTGRPPGLTLARARSSLEKAFAEAGDDGSLVWEIRSTRELRRLGDSLHGVRATDLAAVWSTVEAGDRPLEVRPGPGFEERRLFELLARAVDTSVPYFPLPEPPDRLRWHWPIRVGFRLEDEGLGEALFASLSPAVAGLIEVTVEPALCDILLAWTSADRPMATIVDDRLPDATLAIVFEAIRDPEPLGRARGIASTADAHGIAVVGLGDVGTGREADWLRAFLRELSHTRSVDEALREAGWLAGVYATADLIRAKPLSLAGESMIARLERTRSVTSADPPHVPNLPERTLTALSFDVTIGEPPTLPDVGAALRGAELAFDEEEEGATDVANVGRAVEPIIRDLEEQAAEDRYIRAAVDVLRRDRPAQPVRQGFQAGGRHRISVSIGPRTEGLIVATAAIAPEALADAAGHRLTVVLSEPALLRKPLVRTLELPAFGPSGSAVFEFVVRRSADAVKARIAVLHRGRILQTAILDGPVLTASALDRLEGTRADAAISLRPEANLRPGFPGLDDRRRFQTAIVLNEHHDGRHGGTLVSGSKAAQFDFDFIRDAVAGVSEVLDRAERDDAFERELGSTKSLAYLRRLATEGSGLYTAIGLGIERQLGSTKLERLQVFSANPNTMLPVELIYDLPPPRPDGAVTLCENATRALETGACEARFHVPDLEDFLPVICPSGFWGISKVIERQVADGDEARAAFEVRAVGDQRRHSLRPLAPVLLAVSDHVNDVEKQESRRITQALERLTDGRVTPVRRWREWAEVVARDQPPVIVVLSHTELAVQDGPSLEIAEVGGSERRSVAQIRKGYVNPSGAQPGPVVLLLGCTTAVPLESFQSFTVQFGAMGAAVVIGTIAPVLGRHASRTAEALVEELGVLGRDPARKRGMPVGDAIRAVRRRLLGRGILMSLSLAAYGDTDWRLPAEV